MGEEKYVLFQVGEGIYGLPITSVERILSDQNPCRVPRAPKVMLGMFELRGQTLAAIDLRTRFDLPVRNEPGTYIVADLAGCRCALKVDVVTGIVTIPAENLEKAPDTVVNPSDPFVDRIAKHGGRLVAIVDPATLLPEKIRAKVELPVAA